MFQLVLTMFPLLFNEFPELEEEIFPPLVMERKEEIHQEIYTDFFYEDLVPMQPYRESLLTYIREFSDEKYVIVDTENARFYFERGSDRELLGQKEIQRILATYVVPGSTVVDYGAKIGSSTLLLAQLVGVTGNVLAFEPSFKQFRDLFWNMVLNGVQNVQLYCTELGERNNSLDALELDQISLIKIDAQGHEDTFLKGAFNTIREHKPVLIIQMVGGIALQRADKYVRQEFHNRLQKLEEMGYSTQQITQNYYLAFPK